MSLILCFLFQVVEAQVLFTDPNEDPGCLRRNSRPAMDMEEEVESTSGQVHGGKQSTKEESRERKDNKIVSRNLKTFTYPCTPNRGLP